MNVAGGRRAGRQEPAASEASAAESRVRVGYVIDSLRRHGTQRALLYLVTGLAEWGYEQRVYCLNDIVDPDTHRQLTGCGARVVVIGKRRLMSARGLLALFLDLRHWRPHIIQTFLPAGDVIGRAVARAAGVPVIVSSIRARNIEKRPWQFMLDRVTLRWVDRVVFNSERIIPFALQHEGVRPEQVVYIPNCVQVERQAGGLMLGEARAQLGIPAGARVIGTVGRLYGQKGHRFLLLAFRSVVTAMPNTVLLLIGDGPLGGQLQAEAARLGIDERVRFLGERADVPQLLELLDLYVQPSLYEGMPNALMEAMAAGKAVVATSVDGIQELVVDGECGWLVEAGNVQALAGRMLYALENDGERAAVGAAAARRMHTDFSVERTVRAYDMLYRNLLAQVGW